MDTQTRVEYRAAARARQGESANLKPGEIMSTRQALIAATKRLGPVAHPWRRRK